MGPKSLNPGDGVWRLRYFIYDLSRAFILRAATVLALCAQLVVCFGSEVARCQELGHKLSVDWADYASAAEFCRGDVERPMSLSPDKRILCYDGWIGVGQDISLAKGLADEGSFVVRSFGGSVVSAMALASLLRDRRATVVIYDYCLSACAAYLFIAAEKTLVLQGSLVAWHHWQTNSPFDGQTSSPFDCTWLKVAKDGGPKRLERWACSDNNPEGEYGQAIAMHTKFYAERTVDKDFEYPPESFTIRKILRSMFEGTGAYPDVGWTWNPRFYNNTIKTKVIYQAYPESQDEVDAMVARIHIRRVIYDP
jgi:hypothetical protein